MKNLAPGWASAVGERELGAWSLEWWRELAVLGELKLKSRVRERPPWLAACGGAR